MNSRFSSLACLPALAVGLLLTVPVRAQTAEKSTAPEPITQHMHKLAKVLTNAKLKLKRGGGGGFARQGTETQATPGWTCCAANLKRVEKSVVAVQSMLLQLEHCYNDAAETEALIAVRLAKRDLQQLALAVQTFSDAPAQPKAEQAMNAVFRTFLNLDESVADLIECGELLDPSLVETSETSLDEPEGG